MRIRPLCSLLTLSIAFAGDGISPRGSAEDYTAHAVTGKVGIGAALVPPAQVKKIFGEDLDKHGYVVFEVGMFPVGNNEVAVSPDDFRLKQGKESSVSRAATPHMVADDLHPQRTPDRSLPGNVHVYTSETVGVYKGSNGQHGVYTETSATVTNQPAPPPPPSTRNTGSDGLEQRIEERSLPDTTTKRDVAGYVFFPKPSGDKKADYELMYLGPDGQVSLMLPPPK